VEPYIITFYNTRGGSGTTLLSINTAAALQQEFGERVLLLDAKAAPLGDVFDTLKMPVGRTVADLLPLLDSTSSTILAESLPEKWDGMSVTSLYGDIVDKSKVTPWNFRELLGKISSQFEFIVIDAGGSFDGFVQIALDFSDKIIVPTLPEVISLQHTHRLLEFLQNAKYSGSKIEIILNKISGEKKVKDMFKELLHRNVEIEIPESNAIIETQLSEGVPAVIKNPRNKFSQSVIRLVHLIEDKRQESKTNKNRWTVNIKLEGTTSAIETKDSKSSSSKNNREQNRTDLKRRVHKRLVLEMDFSKMSYSVDDAESKDRFEKQTAHTVIQLLDEELTETVSRNEREKLIEEIVAEAVGLGPLEELLADENVNEIMVNNANQIYVEKKIGKSSEMVLTDKTFPSDNHLLAAIDRIVSRVGRRVDESSPMVDARLADGSRVNAIIPPLSLKGPMLTIRKFSKHKLEANDLINFGSISEQMAKFLEACVCTERNIIVSGGTGSGKTTLLNILSNFIPEKDRILTIEDSAELQLQQEHIGRLESRPPNIEGKGAITIRELVKNALRMRPDRIIVGECRGGEALDMLQAMNTGHDGSMTTVHANTPRDAIARLTTLIMMAGMNLPQRAIVEQIASAINIIIQQERLADGSRKITNISEVVGLENDVVILQDIFLFRQTGKDNNGKIKGSFEPTGAVPTFFDLLLDRGIKLSREIFQPTG